MSVRPTSGPRQDETDTGGSRTGRYLEVLWSSPVRQGFQTISTSNPTSVPLLVWKSVRYLRQLYTSNKGLGRLRRSYYETSL